MIDFEHNSDADSRLSAQAILSSVLTDFGHSAGNCVWDISALTHTGKTVSIEVKNRSFSHTKYGDIFAEEAKQTYTSQNYGFDMSLAVNVFNDGYVAIADLYDKNARHFTRMCPKETWPGGDHTPVLKNCLSLPQTALFKLDDDGKFRRMNKKHTTTND